MPRPLLLLLLAGCRSAEPVPPSPLDTGELPEVPWPPCQAPELDVDVELGEHSTLTLRVTWSTTEPATSEVVLSEGSPRWRLSEDDPVTEHEVVLYGLHANTDITLQASSTFADGSTTCSGQVVGRTASLPLSVPEAEIGVYAVATSSEHNMADIQLGLLFPGETPQPARQVARALLEQYTVDGRPWMLVWGRDPDREQQEEREGTTLQALRQHLSEAADGFGLWASAVLNLPELGNLPASVQVFEDAALNEALLSINEDILFSRGAEAQVAGALLALGGMLLEAHDAPLGFLGREASGADLGVAALSEVSRADLQVFELAFWPESHAQFPVTADLYRLQAVVVQYAGRSLGPEPMSGPLPSGLEPITLGKG